MRRPVYGSRRGASERCGHRRGQGGTVAALVAVQTVRRLAQGVVDQGRNEEIRTCTAPETDGRARRGTLARLRASADCLDLRVELPHSLARMSSLHPVSGETERRDARHIAPRKVSEAPLGVAPPTATCTKSFQVTTSFPCCPENNRSVGRCQRVPAGLSCVGSILRRRALAVAPSGIPCSLVQSA